MKKFAFLLGILTLMMCMFAGCAVNKESGKRVITDCSGVQVEIPNKINKVVVTR